MSMQTTPSWRGPGLGIVRILFGVVWAVDAAFKWQPGFITGFYDYVHGAMEGQPAVVKWWIHLWCNVVGVDAHVFAHLTAIGETVVALGLVLGVFSTVIDVVGMLLMLAIWTTAEGFGGPYGPGSMHIGSAIMYVFVFGALWLSYAGRYLGMDSLLTRRLGRFGWLASA
jgi:nitrite reductase (NO-forming)